MEKQLNMSNFETKECPNDGCTGNIFNQLYKIKKLSALVSPSGKEVIMQIPVFLCVECGNIWEPEGE